MDVFRKMGRQRSKRSRKGKKKKKRQRGGSFQSEIGGPLSNWFNRSMKKLNDDEMVRRQRGGSWYDDPATKWARYMVAKKESQRGRGYHKIDKADMNRGMSACLI